MAAKKPSLTLLALVLCCALVLVPVLCSILYFSTSVSRRLEKTARETVSFYIGQLAGQTSATLETLRGSIYYLMSDDRIRRMMRSPEDASQSERLAIEEGLSRAFFLGNQLDQSTVTGIYLVKDRTHYLSVLRSGLYLGTASRVMQVYDALGAQNSARDLYVEPSYPDYCYMIVDYFDLLTMKPLGKIFIELKVSGLVDTTYLDAIYRRAVVVLRTNDGRILSGQDTAFVRSLAASDSEYVTVGQETYYHATRSLAPSRATIDIFVPRSEIFEATRETIKVYIFFALFVLLLTLAVGTAAVYLLYKPLRQILHKIDRLATGDLTVRMDETPYRETDHMSAAFNNMADRLEALFSEVYEQGVLLRDAEFKLLESQIRPHFIFNVLELINIRCLEAGEHGICHMVSNLAQLLRANILHKHAQTISLQEELRYVRYYLELQKERFGDSLSFSIDLEDPDILHYALPKLTIQPLVENSIVHGLEPQRGGGTVRISIWEEEDAVCIRITDDGVGFDTAQISLDPDADTRHHHVALVNIARRIQLLYGKHYGLQIQSAQGQGTEITVTLPAQPGHPTERGESGCSKS